MARVTFRGKAYLLKTVHEAVGPMDEAELLAEAGPAASLYGITGANISEVLRAMTTGDKTLALGPDGTYSLTDDGLYALGESYPGFRS